MKLQLEEINLKPVEQKGQSFISIGKNDKISLSTQFVKDLKLEDPKAVHYIKFHQLSNNPKSLFITIHQGFVKGGVRVQYSTGRAGGLYSQPLRVMLQDQFNKGKEFEKSIRFYLSKSHIQDGLTYHELLAPGVESILL